MIVTVNMIHGCLSITPKSAVWRRRFLRLLLSGEKLAGDTGWADFVRSSLKVDNAPSVFLQLESDVGSFLENNCSASAQKDIAAGWTAHVRIDPWEFGQMLGYDCGDRLIHEPSGNVATDDSRSFGPSGRPAGWQG